MKAAGTLEKSLINFIKTILPVSIKSEPEEGITFTVQLKVEK